MANTYNITMKQYNGTDYDTLYPTTGGGQVTPSSSILEQFNIINSINTTGNYTNLEDILGYLGTLNMYWWKRRSAEISIQGSSGSYTIDAQTVYYSDELVLTGSRVVSLKDPESIYVTGRSSSQTPTQDLSFLNGKYLKFSSGNFTGYFCKCTSISYGFLIGSAGQFGWTANFQYFTSVSVAYGNWEYFQSTSSSTYPQSGIQDGYEYVFLGTPFQNIINGAQIEVGSYTGTGTYGSSNPNSFILNGIPKFLIICDSSHILVMSFTNDGNVVAKFITTNSSEMEITATISDNTLSWYSSFSNTAQMNRQTSYTIIYFT